MKQNCNKKWTKTLIVLLALLPAFGSNNAYAAYTLYNTPIGTDNPLTNQPNNAPTWMNNSIFNNSNGSVQAVAWDEGGGNGMYAEVFDNTGGVQLIHLGQVVVNAGGTVEHPDIVLGGDASNNYMAVVYTGIAGANRDVFIEVYTLTNVNNVSPSLNYTTCTTYNFQLTTNHTASNAHIDLAYEMYGVSNPKADRFVVSWEQGGTCIINFNVGAWACHGSLAALAGCGAYTITYAPGCLNQTGLPNPSAGRDVDIAVRGSSGNYKAFFTFWDNVAGNNQMYVGDWNLGSTLNKGTAQNNFGGNSIEYPRIDAADGPLGAGNTPFDIVIRATDGITGAWNVTSWNGLAQDEVTSHYNVNPGSTYYQDNSKPVVTAGSEDYNTNTRLYTLAYQNTYLNAVWAQNININGGATYGTPDYRLVNTSAINVASDPVAISSDYTYDGVRMYGYEVFVSWYDATNNQIDYKITTAAPPVYKPGRPGENTVIASTPNMGTAKKHASISPIPASDEISIAANGRAAKSYTISDVMGRTLLKGDINQDQQQVDISALAAGVYLVNISYADNADVDGIRIAKQ
ncbi:MAG: T9SS type A sorting domain-containing protein [Bacteroidetes bacterium]|nr:T9SS type A sorting domain-containing protein [Bacteroidota bacterium]